MTPAAGVSMFVERLSASNPPSQPMYTASNYVEHPKKQRRENFKGILEWRSEQEWYNTLKSVPNPDKTYSIAIEALVHVSSDISGRLLLSHRGLLDPASRIRIRGHISNRF